MLKQLRIQNFKGWQDTGVIRMAPITLFFGANSSGKSSIGQFLMMLKQTVESPDRKAVFYPGGRNTAVQLGSYQEMVFQRNPDARISFEYQWSMPEALKIRDSISEQTYTGDSLDFLAEVGLGNEDHHTLAVEYFRYQLLDKEKIALEIGLQRASARKSDYKATASLYTLVGQRGRPWSIKGIVRFYGFPDEMVASYQNADFIQDINLQHEKLFRSLAYLGPLRTKADRLYSWTGIEPESVGYAGENTVAAILAARNRKISLGRRLKTRSLKARPFEEIIALKLKEMGLIDDFKVNPISEQRQEYEVKVRTRGSADWVDLPDVGFGVSQVLPVLVQCFYAPPGSIILMEQPEIHLHPSAQSALADVMIDVINARENGADRNIQLIIETHSEHFLRRLQRRIAEDKVSKERVAAYFADITKAPATLDPLQIDEYGQIRNWPENFFGDEMEDITEQAKAALFKRMQSESTSAEASQ